MRLAGGGVLRARRVEWVGDRVVLHSDAGTVSLAAEKVLSVREAAPGASGRPDVNMAPVAPTEALGGAARQAPASGSQGVRVELEGPAWAGMPDLAPVVRAGDLERAERLARDGLVAAPADSRRRIALGEVQVALAHLADAVATLRMVPPDALAVPLRRARDLALAAALARLNRTDEAARVLRATPPDAGGRVAAALAAIERDESLGGRPLAQSTHFAVVAPPGTRASGLTALLEEIEDIHARLSVELGGAPRDRVTVVLYPGTEFWDATGMSHQVGALYDGRVRVPSGRLDPPSPALSAALRHEVTHAFVDALSGGRADVRWHEGLAEHFEGSDAGPPTRALAQGLRRAPDAWPPPLSHANSHARMEWFLSRWGMAGVREVLAGMASRGTIDAAVRAATGLADAELDLAWKSDLSREKP